MFIFESTQGGYGYMPFGRNDQAALLDPITDRKGQNLQRLRNIPYGNRLPNTLRRNLRLGVFPLHRAFFVKRYL